LKKVEVIKAHEVEVQPFSLDDFTRDDEKQNMTGNISKKELKQLAEDIGLSYNEAQIMFAKKLLNAYLLGK